MYVVLASRATTTTVWIGWEDVKLESNWSSGVSRLFSHEGAAA
jgi:hypothetical protein